MSRAARRVFPDLPHHVVQRGNRRCQVFFSDGDREAYLRWLRRYCDQYSVQVLAYCLMPNHVHAVVVPGSPRALELVFRPLHTAFARHVNRAHGWSGHLWQGRFFSSVLDESYFWTAIRYVECNPVRAGMVRRAEEYPWSSAAAHCGLRGDGALNASARWSELMGEVRDWRSWLAAHEPDGRLDALRRNTLNIWPSGTSSFVEMLGSLVGVNLGPRPMGRPKK